jgi:hypothetical protein
MMLNFVTFQHYKVKILVTRETKVGAWMQFVHVWAS